MPPETPQSTKPIPLAFEHLGVLDVVGEAGVAAVDDEVALVEQVGRAWRWCRGSAAPAGTITQTTRGASSALTIAAMRAHVGDLGVAVEADDLVAGAAQALAHVAAHLPETDETKLHG